MNNFLNFIALVFGILASLLFIVRVLGAATYNDRDEISDRIRGIRRTFPLTVPLLVLIVCWTWYITKPLG